MNSRREPHILVVDDDQEIQKLLKKFLMQHGYRMTTVSDGTEMRKALRDWNIDLLILDIMLPGEDGFALCRDVRRTSKIPIIMLTAVGEDTDRILGLELGADDYLTKPFNPRELLARIRAIFRRAETGTTEIVENSSEKVRFGNWVLNLGSRELRDADDVVVHLSTGEFSLLRALVKHNKRPLSRDQLVDIVRGQSSIPFDRSIDIQISRLRRKIEKDAKNPKLIKTVRGIGYQFCADVSPL
ncbi:MULTISPECIES: response regulator [unclassified Thalassospira]|uniref:response regulator n=1 Tax=unclassified Thalassospira TaxID=2648997 RepID=UPI000A1D67A3|nr:response regulator [Thalassospira sp. MCCC 1A01428]OSQ42383.1 chemotaxis protein CheY [Thalassospira sp. MCCC 1A01428]